MVSVVVVSVVAGALIGVQVAPHTVVHIEVVDPDIIPLMCKFKMSTLIFNDMKTFIWGVT